MDEEDVGGEELLPGQMCYDELLSHEEEKPQEEIENIVLTDQIGMDDIYNGITNSKLPQKLDTSQQDENLKVSSGEKVLPASNMQDEIKNKENQIESNLQVRKEEIEIEDEIIEDEVVNDDIKLKEIDEISSEDVVTDEVKENEVFKIGSYKKVNKINFYQVTI